MPKYARHLEVIEDSKKYINIMKTTKKQIKNIIKSTRDDEYKRLANIYAKSLHYIPPNFLSYEK